MSPGLGQPLLPRPQFSSNNPYWQRPSKLSPPLTARDFLYASMWEINRRFDVHGAACVRAATVLTVKLNWPFELRNQLQKHNLKEIQRNA